MRGKEGKEGRGSLVLRARGCKGGRAVGGGKEGRGGWVGGGLRAAWLWGKRGLRHEKKDTFFFHAVPSKSPAAPEETSESKLKFSSEFSSDWGGIVRFRGRRVSMSPSQGPRTFAIFATRLPPGKSVSGNAARQGRGRERERERASERASERERERRERGERARGEKLLGQRGAGRRGIRGEAQELEGKR